MTDDNSIQIYQSPDGETCVDVRFEKETVWLTQAQMVALFHRDVSVISRHIKNAVHEGEINEKSKLQKMQIARSDKPVTLYDLDVVISVGYRVKSPQGVQFRRWATQRLRDYLIKGYTIDQQRFEENATELKQALATLNPMEKIHIIENKNHIHIENNHHQTIARFSNKGKAKWHGKTQTILHARVLGVVRRQKSDGEDYDGKHEKIESWELPIVEILHKKLI